MGTETELVVSIVTETGPSSDEDDPVITDDDNGGVDPETELVASLVTETDDDPVITVDDDDDDDGVAELLVSIVTETDPILDGKDPEINNDANDDGGVDPETELVDSLFTESCDEDDPVITGDNDDNDDWGVGPDTFGKAITVVAG